MMQIDYQKLRVELQKMMRASQAQVIIELVKRCEVK